jgi:hypothetical protein
MSETYPYTKSANDRYILLRDGAEKLRGTEQELWRWLHRSTSTSVFWALKYEGYEIKPEETDGVRMQDDL